MLTRLRVALPALLLATTFTSLAFETTSERFTFEDAGQPRVFAPLSDQIAIRDTSGRTRLQARAVPPSAGESSELILSELIEGSPSPRLRYVRPELIVRADSASAARSAATALGLTYIRSLGQDRHLLSASGSAAALAAITPLSTQPGIRAAHPSLARQQSKRLVPNDPFFTSQWHLRNTGQSGGTTGIDVNVVNTWDTYRGSGIRLAIIDDGLQTAHPDLSANVDTTNDHDWNDTTPDDPNPVLTADFHGTACAGVAAARGSNGVGVSGAAPLATLVGLRLIGDVTSDTQEADAIAWKNDLIAIKSNSWGPNDDGLTLEAPGPLTRAALATAASTGRGGLGTIILWAGGNGGDVGDNSNYDGYANDIHTIAVAALTQTGAQSYYGEPGANLVISAPSNGGTDPGITTVDLTDSKNEAGYNYTGLAGNLTDRAYTNDFGGTSSATPLAAGVVALLLESRPTLGWRDVQEVLMKSATKVSPTDADWVTNAGGFAFNHKFGAGLINAAAAISLAQTWTNLPVATSQSLPRTALAQSIPDNSATGTSVTFDLSNNANLRAEHVTVTVNISHLSRGHLAITLTSPQGTVSRLAEKHADTGDNFSNWTFMTVRNWGESTQGVWTLKVADLTSGTTGTISSATLTVHGTPAASVNRRPTVTSASLDPAAELYAEDTQSLANVSVSDPESDAFTLAYQWQLSSDTLSFTDISGATSPTLPADPARAGKILRCRITPSDTSGSGAAFFTAARPLNRRPSVVAVTGTAYSYDSELYVASRSATFTRPALVNEFSQGNGGSKEWIEILFLTLTDARGWTLADRTTNPAVTFSQSTLWSAIPAGTLLVIYNGADRDTVLPADKTSLTSTRTLVIASSNTTYFTGNWPSLSNSNADFAALRTATGTLIDGVSINIDATHTPALGTLGANTSAAYQADTDAGADLIDNWLKPAAGTATPAAGNGTLNTAFVANLVAGAFNQPATFRFGTTSQTPAGLSLDPTTGLLSGTLTAAPGVYAIILERTNGIATVAQTIRLLVTAADGSATIPAGTSWAPNIDTTLPAGLTIAGTLDTAGHALTVTGAVTLTGGTVLNAAPGSITYGGLTGGTLPGTTFTASSSFSAWIATYPGLTGTNALPSADPDADGQANLVEYALGTDPALTSSFAALTPAVVNGHLRLTVPRRALPNLLYDVKASTDLATWSSIWTSTGSENTSATVIVEDPLAVPAGGRRFLRLEVSAP
jgi:subtilisin-like proprotein convertase family protein